MSRQHKSIVLAFAAAAAFAWSDARGAADPQAPIPPVNDAPNPYITVSDYFKLPSGRPWGSTNAVDIDPDGKSIWVVVRCDANGCLDTETGEIKDMSVVLKFDEAGNLVKSFGGGLMILPHGLHVDKDGNVWVSDIQDNASPAPWAPPPGTPSVAPQPPRANPTATKGHQVFKFSPDGQLLLTLGKAGGDNGPNYFFQPNDVITSPDGNFIFVSEGHNSVPGTTARVLKFDKAGKFIKSWGTWGSGDGEFDQPHALAFDSRGRLFVGDRSNNRIQIFDQDGNFIDKWYQFSRPSGIYIDKNDILYSADSESDSVAENRQDWKRGIRIGSVRDGNVTAFIPDPDPRGRPEFTGTSAAEGVVVDAAGNVYGAEVRPRGVKKYVKK